MGKEAIEEPTALATDVGKPIPILSGKSAERFVKLMEENERKARERANKPKSKDDLEKQLTYLKFVYDMEKSNLEDIKNKIIETEEQLKHTHN
jgi:hypothetical protein